MLELKDTAASMGSDNYKDRFRAEYYQLVIRYKKLTTMLEKWDRNELDFIPNCNRGIFNMQQRIMADYIAVLESRAQIEDIELWDINKLG